MHELEYEGVPVDFLNVQRCFPNRRRWERIRGNESNLNIEMNVSRCGPELADILVNGFARKAPRGGVVDPQTLNEHGLERKPATTTFPVAIKGGQHKDDARQNKVYPASVFGQAREEFWNAYD